MQRHSKSVGPCQVESEREKHYQHPARKVYLGPTTRAAKHQLMATCTSKHRVQLYKSDPIMLRTAHTKCICPPSGGGGPKPTAVIRY